jgi:CO/xanthine dehydrogenase FAD-binding subunit
MGDYLRPGTLDEALAALSEGGWRVLAGGTDLYPVETGRQLPFPVLDVAGLAPLRDVGIAAGELRIGACARWSEIARADLPPALAALQQAAVEVGGRQVQNAGTIGGNLCNASPAADGVPPLLVAGAIVELASRRGVRRLALEDFLTGPRQTARAADELLTAVIVPPAGLQGRSRFLKLGARSYLVISIAMVAARIVTDAGRITGAALAVGACSATARRLPGVEAALIGAPLADAVGRIGDDVVAAALSPLDDLRATAAYRGRAAAELLRRAVAELTEAGA